jgi:hypothetical protein
MMILNMSLKILSRTFEKMAPKRTSSYTIFYSLGVVGGRGPVGNMGLQRYFTNYGNHRFHNCIFIFT